MLILLPSGIGLRKSDNLSEPLKDYPFVSMSGKPLNRALKKLFSNAARESDIRQIIRHNDFRKGYDPKNKIEVLEDCLLYTSDAADE